MSEWNVFYRAFLDYKKKTAEDKNIKRLCDSIKAASADDDCLESVRTYCVIDEDWIQIIEEGMDHVEKAVRAERQFIRKQGEVVPIEKLKHVSTDTVTHLARHSELITKEPLDDEVLTPEKLYMAENLSDFAVYENRFLYMLLCYLRDFINIRLDKILELGKTYRFSAKLKKRIKIGKKSIRYTSEMLYEDKNDKLSENYSDSISLIERIETAQRLVTSLLMTPLMKEVSKAPMLQPPIVRTNVLRMNVDFKAAFEMYGKLSSYGKDGYKIEEIKHVMRPFPDALMSEEAELISLQQFLYYKYGNKLSETLWAEYQEEEKARKEKEKLELKARSDLLRASLLCGEATQEEYISVLEEQLRDYGQTLTDLQVAKQKISNLSERLEQTETTLAEEKQTSSELRETIAEKEREIKQNEERHRKELFELELKNREEIRQVEKKYIDEIKTIQESCEEKCKVVTQEYLEAEKKLSEEMKAVQENCEEKCKTAMQECAKEQEARVLLQAQLKGLRSQYGLMTAEDDYSSKERFSELEKEFEALELFLKEQYKYAKKRIRKDILWQPPKKNEKKQETEQNEESAPDKE